MELSYDPAILLLGMDQKEMESGGGGWVKGDKGGKTGNIWKSANNEKHVLHSMFTAASFTTGRL